MIPTVDSLPLHVLNSSAEHEARKNDDDSETRKSHKRVGSLVDSGELEVSTGRPRLISEDLQQRGSMTLRAQKSSAALLSPSTLSKIAEPRKTKSLVTKGMLDTKMCTERFDKEDLKQYRRERVSSFTPYKG